MTLPSFRRTEPALREASRPRGRVLTDLVILYLLLALAVALIAHGPSHLYRFSQLSQVNAAIDLAHGRNWLFPELHTGELFRKPPMVTWMLAGVFQMTDVRDEVVFRIPTIIASFVTLTLLYLLARRWMGRRAALVAGVLWITALHMSKMLFLALTDPVLTAWITASVFTLDRVLFHPAPRPSRWKWVVAFWITVIGGAMTKGWGIANLPMLALLAALAAVLGPGFGALRKVSGADKPLLAVRLIVRRLLSAAKLVKLHWGLLAMVAVIAPYLWYGWSQGGEEFRQILEFEIWQRITGHGPNAPRSGTLPTAVYLLYYDLPVSALAVGALMLVHPKRWFSRRSWTVLPLVWILAWLVPYSLSHGFRPDYLYPCYASVAILAAGGVDHLVRHGASSRGPSRVAFELFRGMPTTLSIVILLGCLRYLLPELAPEAIRDGLPQPWFVAAETWTMLWVVTGLAAIVAVIGVWASLSWKPRLLVALIALPMLGAQFLHTHMVSPHARSGDGVKMRDFALAVHRHVGPDEPLHMYRSKKLTIECYLGRFGQYYDVDYPWGTDKRARTLDSAVEVVLGRLQRHTGEWLITTDRGLIELGAAQQSPDGKYKLSKKRRFTTYPAQLGEVVLQGHHIRAQKWGSTYLIRIGETMEVTGEPHDAGHIPYRSDDAW